MTANEALNSYFASIPRGEKMKEVRRLADFVYVSPEVVMYWRTGQTRIKPLYRREINKFAGRDLFENVTD